VIPAYAPPPRQSAPATPADAIPTPVNDNCLPGDKGSVIACQEQNGAREILRFSQPFDRLQFPCAAFLLF
jgi:hypothetical protein